MPIGDSLFLDVNDLAARTPWLHAPAAAFATYGIVVFGVLMLVGWWIARRREDTVMAAALLAPAAALVALAAQQVVVAVVDEARPYALHRQALVLVSRTTDPSFPSDHACVAAAVAAALFLVDRRLGGLAAALAALMAVTRVYVGVHWPLDVVAGLALGAGVSLVVVLLLRRPVGHLVALLRGSRLQPVLGEGAVAAA